MKEKRTLGKKEKKKLIQLGKVTGMKGKPDWEVNE